MRCTGRRCSADAAARPLADDHPQVASLGLSVVRVHWFRVFDQALRSSEVIAVWRVVEDHLERPLTRAELTAARRAANRYAAASRIRMVRVPAPAGSGGIRTIPAPRPLRRRPGRHRTTHRDRVREDRRRSAPRAAHQERRSAGRSPGRHGDQGGPWHPPAPHGTPGSPARHRPRRRPRGGAARPAGSRTAPSPPRRPSSEEQGRTGGGQLITGSPGHRALGTRYCVWTGSPQRLHDRRSGPADRATSRHVGFN